LWTRSRSSPPSSGRFPVLCTANNTISRTVHAFFEQEITERTESFQALLTLFAPVHNP
jgi:hypothetical protein